MKYKRCTLTVLVLLQIIQKFSIQVYRRTVTEQNNFSKDKGNRKLKIIRFYFFHFCVWNASIRVCTRLKV